MWRTQAVCLLASLLSCQGVPAPTQDLATLLANVDTYLSAVGATRVRRDADFDKEFAIDKYGIGIGLSYKDRSDKGGKFYFKLKDTRFDVFYDLVQKDDGYFTVDLNYAWEDKTGVVTVSRQLQEDGQSLTKIVVQSHELKLELVGTSDYETTGTFTMKYELTRDGETRTEDVKLEVEYEKNRRLKVDVWRNGQYYGLAVKANIADLKGDLELKTPARTYKLTGRATIKGDWKVNVEGEVKGPMSFLMLLKKDYSEAKLELNHKNKKMLQCKIKSTKIDDTNYKVKAKWALLGGKLAKGDMDSTYSDGHLRIEVTPFNRPVVNFHGFYLPQHEADSLTHLKFGYDAQRGGSQISKYEGELNRINTEAVYDTKFHSELEVTKGSLIYTSLCKLGQLMGGGCFETRTMAVQTHVEKLNKNMFMNKYAFKVTNTKDGQTNLDIDLNTLETAPYTVKVMTPLLTEQLGRDTFLVTAARTPGKGFTVESNIRDTRFTFTHGQETQEGLKGKGFHAELRNDGDTTIKYDLFLNYEKNEGVSTQLKGRSKLFIKPGSLTAAELCKLEGGCFTERTARLDLEADQTGLAPRWTFAVDIANDGVTVFKSDLHTAEAGGVLSAKMTSTYEALKTIDVDITLATADTEVLVNGKKEFDVILTPQKSLDTRGGWDSNEVGVKVAGAADNLVGKIHWDGQGAIGYEAKGRTKLLGAVDITRDMVTRETEKGFRLELRGSADTETSWINEAGWNPLVMEVQLEVETEEVTVNGDIAGSVGGRPYKALVENTFLVFV